MQKVALALSIIALALGIYAVTAIPSSSDADSPSEVKNSTQEMDFNGNGNETSLDEADQPRIAFIRTDSLYAKCQFIIDADAELAATTKTSEGKFQRAYQEVEREVQELQAFAQGPGVTNEDLQMAQNRMMELEYELQMIQQKENDRVLRKEQKLTQEVTERLTEYIDRFAVDNDIDIIINKGLSGEGVIYGSQPFDVTSQVIAGLNAEYALEQSQDAE